MKLNKNTERLLEKLKAKYEPEYIPVKIEKYSKLHHCYYNVEHKVKVDGGDIFYGWIVHETNLLCEAEHHAVWKDSDENLIDISPNQDNSLEILFIPDNDCKYRGLSIDSVRINITKNFMVDDFIYICEFIEKLYALGTRINDEKVIVSEEVLELITQYQVVKMILLEFIEKKTNKSKFCICGANKSYRECCHKILKSSAEKQFQSLIKTT